MRIASKICVITATVLWAVALFALLMTWLGVAFVPVGYDYVSVFEVDGNHWILPTWCAALGVTALALILSNVFKHKEAANWIPLLLGIGSAAVALVVALEMKSALPAKVGTQYLEQGINAWKLIWRHLTPVMAGGLAAIAAWLNRAATRDDRIAAENAAYKEHYDLSGDPLFSDDKSTIGLDTYAEDFGIQKPTHRLKKSLRRKKNK